MFVFDRYVIARILRDAGYVIAAKVKGGLLTKCATASGIITVEGDLVDEMGSTIVTPGDLVVDGGMITEGDDDRRWHAARTRLHLGLVQ